MTYELAPVPPTPQPSRGGRTVRNGGIAAACLVLVVGAAVIVAASVAPRTSPAIPGASGPAGAAVPSAGARAPELKESRVGSFGKITIASINGTKIGLKTADGWSRTIDVTADTKIFLGSLAGKLSDLAVGNQVRLHQKRNADGSYSIVSLTVPAAKASGEVTAVSGNTVTIKRRDGTTATVTLDGSTVIKQGDATATKADVKVGSKISAEGKPGSNDAFTATKVRISLSTVSGDVTAKTSDTITVKQRDGSSVVIHVGASTRYRAPGIKGTTATLANVAIGNRLTATGVKRSDGSLDAVAVQARAAKLPKTTQPLNPAAPSPSGKTG